MATDPYALGTIQTFSAAATVLPGGDLDEPTAEAREMAYNTAQEWAEACPVRVGLFRIHESWDLEEHGGTWLLTFTLKVRLVDPAETITLPGEWDYTSGRFLS